MEATSCESVGVSTKAGQLQSRAALWRARLPGLGAAALVVVLALLALAPRLMADYSVTCLLMGGDWGDYRGWDNGTICRFERP